MPAKNNRIIVCQNNLLPDPHPRPIDPLLEILLHDQFELGFISRRDSSRLVQFKSGEVEFGIAHALHGPVGMPFSITKPHQDTGGLALELPHERYLLLFFGIVPLVDAQSVYPNRFPSNCGRPILVAQKNTNNMFKVRTDEDF